MQHSNRIRANVFPLFVLMLGIIISIIALYRESKRLGNPNRFSVSTKIPVQIFCISGPLVLLTLILYLLLLILLYLQPNRTTSVFYISSSWTIIFMDMNVTYYFRQPVYLLPQHQQHHPIGSYFYNHPGLYDLSKTDLSLHLVNIITVIHSYSKLPFIPLAFIIGSLSFWFVYFILSFILCFQSNFLMEDVNPI